MVSDSQVRDFIRDSDSVSLHDVSREFDITLQEAGDSVRRLRYEGEVKFEDGGFRT